MKKLSNKEIEKKFEEVTKSWCRHLGGTGNVTLDGTFCSDELREIARVLDEVNHGTPEERNIEKTKQLSVKGFTSKDIKVTYSKLHEDSKNYIFSFYIMKDGKDYSFYYGKSDQGAGDWWPESGDEFELSPIHDFIPYKFSESMENCYEFSGTNEEAIEFLKQCGFIVEKGDDWH